MNPTGILAMAQAFTQSLRYNPALAMGLGVSLDDAASVRSFTADLIRVMAANRGLNMFEVPGKPGVSLDDETLLSPMALTDWDPMLHMYRYPALVLAEAFFTKSTLRPGTIATGFSVYDTKGEWTEITDEATDIPNSHVTGDHETVPVGIHAGGFSVGAFEQDRLGRAGLNIDSLRLKAHNKGRVQRIHNLLYGAMMDDNEILEEPVIARGGNTAWADKTGEEIVLDISDGTAQQRKRTKRTWGTTPDFTMFIGGDTEKLLSQKKMLPGYDVANVIDYLNTEAGRTVTKVKKTVVVQEFDDKPFNSGTSDGFVIGPADDPECVQFEESSVIPFAPEFHKGQLWIGARQYYIKKLKWLHKAAFLRLNSIG